MKWKILEAIEIFIRAWQLRRTKLKPRDNMWKMWPTIATVGFSCCHVKGANVETIDVEIREEYKHNVGKCLAAIEWLGAEVRFSGDYILVNCSLRTKPFCLLILSYFLGDVSQDDKAFLRQVAKHINGLNSTRAVEPCDYEEIITPIDDLPATLIAIRKSHDLTQTEAAAKSKSKTVDQPLISNYERGVRSMTALRGLNDVLSLYGLKAEIIISKE